MEGRAILEIEQLSLAEVLPALWRALALRWTDVTVVVAVTLLSLAILNRIAPHFDMLDQPDGARKTHGRPTPLTGGGALLLGAWIGALVSTSVGQIDYEVLALLGIVATVHAFDDHSSLSPRQRLVIDAVVALAFVVITRAAILTLGAPFGAELHLGWLAVPVTVFAYLALTNAYNMMDGIDGLALVQFLVAIAGVAVWHVMHAHRSGFDPLAFSVVASCLTVLAANVGLLGRRLKCFLGDSGARFLGFFLVYVMLSTSGGTLTPVHGVYFVALPLLDMCAVIFERFRLGRRLMRPDRLHLHYLVIDAGGSRSLALTAMTAISLGFIAAAIALEEMGASDLGVLAIFLALAIAYWSGRRGAVRVVAGLVNRRRVVGPAE